MRIAPYILAGGRSSRMGRDKAMIVLGGKTLLARAVKTLQSLDPGSSREGTGVTVIGERTVLEGADRSICDRYPGCGPLGGMEAALSDLERTGAADWALFLPVDMPFLSAGLIEKLRVEWVAAAEEGAKVCHVVVDDRPQPLISMIHRELRPYLEGALKRGEFRVTPVLRCACAAIASDHVEGITSSGPVFWQTMFKSDAQGSADTICTASDMQQRSRHLWFANLNTESDLHEAETFL